MIDFSSSKEITVKASPEAVFDVVGDLMRHQELAGSGEVLAIRKLTDGPTGFGSVIEADESINIGGEIMEFPATSVVVAFDPPKSISWIPVPPLPTRRIQWWFNLSPDGEGTRVTHEVEVDLGEARAMFDDYEGTRAVDIARGMDKTLENLRRSVEK